MIKKIYLFIILLGTTFLLAENPTAQEIIQAVDANLISTSSKAETKMIVHARRASRTMESINYARGSEKAFSEYLSPPREKGTKMLKLDDNLWIYNPSTDRIIQISGNMLKQSVMGSDLSYEDMMENDKLLEDYNASIIDSIRYNDRNCWIIELIAKKNDVSYYQRRAYIDKEQYVPLYEEWYAKSGKLLKTIKASKVERMDDRWYPTHYLFKDELKEGKGTEYIISSIEFDIDIPDHVFSKAMLRK